MDSEDSEAREDSASEDSHPSTDASEDSVEKLGYGSVHDEVHTNSRRRKTTEPRRLYSDQSKKRPHSPNPDYQAKSPKLSSDEEIRPVKQPKLSTPYPSPPLVRVDPPSPRSSLSTSSIGAPPLIHHSLLSPLARTPTISPSLTPGLSPHLLPPGWPSVSASYQHYTRLLGSVLPNPLALLPGGIHLPPYPMVPLLHHLPKTPPVQSPSPQSPPKTSSPSPTPTMRSSLQESSRNQINEAIQCRSREPLQDEPVSLVKRETSAAKPLFSVASLVETPINVRKSPLKPPTAPLPPSKTTPSTSQRKVPAVLSLPQSSPNLKLKSEATPSYSSDDASHQPLGSTNRLAAVSSSSCSPSGGVKLTNSQAHHLQQQQHLLRQKQRNYKNMTRERRIEANARERTRVHTISSAYEKLRQSVPSYSHNQKLSKLSILRIASSYILTLSKLADNSSEQTVADCVEETTKTIQFEGRAKKKRDD
ncbi:hypothetical protein HAZT_HAZT005577 [Hyalella azteca]|uniref:BHLH domain-containing protein n=1 Tax=Hyalella azteca TaxID=294128 RepID=A0A6A0H5M8_HYAAZ|nr:hypothetical protein HAZT_HAZT005577 [Hyalella azteca]